MRLWRFRHSEKICTIWASKAETAFEVRVSVNSIVRIHKKDICF